VTSDLVARLSLEKLSPKFRFSQIMTSDIAIQYQDVLGNWITSVTVPNQPPVILNGMRSVAILCPGRRVRAIDQDSKLIDIL